MNSVFQTLIIASATIFGASPAISQVVEPLDLNRDGWADLWQIEYNVYGVSAADDSDRDGANNGFEGKAGTDPFNEDSSLTPADLKPGSGTEWVVTFPSVAGKVYFIQVNDRLTDDEGWFEFPATTLGTGSILNVSVDGNGVAELSGQNGYARVRVADIDADLDGVTAFEEALLGLSDASGTSNGGANGLTDLEFARNAILETKKFGQGGLELTTAQIEAARLLRQGSFGANWSETNLVAEMGIETWIDSQMALPPSLHEPLAAKLRKKASNSRQGDARNWTWLQHAMSADDQLRQRVAFALSEIFVISDNVNEIYNNPVGAAQYYDILVRGAFGNFEDILTEVSFHPLMGVYLSHLGNRRTIAEENVFPDENYAREIMQLFSIGLFELNPDGTRKQSSNEDIPTYTNEDITGLAKVFTGLNFGGGQSENPDYQTWMFFYLDRIWDQPMEMYDEQHEPGAKTFLGNTINEDEPIDDVYAAINALFNHTNVGPFIGKQLIQRLVTSNPSPAYVARVSAVFDDNGSGVRGDMAAVVKAILMDPEARDTNTALASPTFGKLREPYLRFVALWRAFDAKASGGLLLRNLNGIREDLLQVPLSAPSVFNFYLPNFQPKGTISANDLVAPEFQILNSQSSIDTINVWHEQLFLEEIENIKEKPVKLNLKEEIKLAYDPETLLDRLNLLLAQGALSEKTRETIINSAIPLIQEEYDEEEIVRHILSLLAISPEFNTLR